MKNSFRICRQFVFNTNFNNIVTIMVVTVSLHVYSLKSRNFSYWIFETLNSRMEFLQEVVLYSVHVSYRKKYVSYMKFQQDTPKSKVVVNSAALVYHLIGILRKQPHKRMESFVPIYCHNYSDTVLIIDKNLVIPLCAVSVLIVNLCQSK